MIFKFYININVNAYVYSGADTGFSSGGGGQIGREAPEKFFVPPLSSSGGGDRRLEEGKINRHIKV